MSSQRPSAHLAGPAIAFALTEEAERLRQEDSSRRGDGNARTLLRESGLRLTLIALKDGARLDRHTAPGGGTIQTLSGHLRLRVEGHVIDLPVHHVLALEPNVPHDVEAIGESTFLLTLALLGADAGSFDSA